MAYSLDDIRAMRGIDPETIGTTPPDKKKKNEKEPKLKIENDSNELTQEIKEDFSVDSEWTKKLSKIFTAGIAILFFVLLSALVVKFICLLFF